MQAKKEGFFEGTVISSRLKKKGGRMLPEQRAYVCCSRADAVNAFGYRAGVYCSGIPANEPGGATIITANDLRGNADRRKIVFLVYNDSCPPSPGCTFPRNPPSPQQSGVAFAAIWQFAQSPRRRGKSRPAASFELPHRWQLLRAHFCATDGVNIDLDSADSPDPSSGCR